MAIDIGVFHNGQYFAEEIMPVHRACGRLPKEPVSVDLDVAPRIPVTA